MMAIIIDDHFNSAPSRGSNGGGHRIQFLFSSAKSHARTLWVYGGRSLQWVTSLCHPNVLLSTWPCWDEMVATYTFRGQDTRPLSKRDHKNPRMVGTEQRTGSSFLSEHKAENSFHLFSYCTQVDGVLVFRRVIRTESLHSLSSRLGLAGAKPIVKVQCRSECHTWPPIWDWRSLISGKCHSGPWQSQCSRGNHVLPCQ